MLVKVAANSNGDQLAKYERQAAFALRESVDAHERFVNQSAGAIAAISAVLIRALSDGKKVLFCGNGGSAADAQHAAAELVGRFYTDREPLSALSLTTDTSVLTAVGNDWAFEEIFARQVKGLGAEGDVVVGLSTSGRSKNVVLAFEAAHQRNMTTIALTGEEGRDIAEAADLALCVPSKNTPRIQELHILALHSVCEIVESAMFADSNQSADEVPRAQTS